MLAGAEGQVPALTYEGPKKILEINNEVQQEGLYIKALVCGIKVNCLVDTGSTLTVLHPIKYSEIKDGLKPRINKSCSQLRMADGGLVSPMGVGIFTIEIEGRCFEHRMIVADIEAPVVFGYDFLYKIGCTIDMGTGSIHVNGDVIKCEKESQMSSIFKIKIHEDTIIPADCETILSAKVEGDVAQNQIMIIEQHNLKLNYPGLLLANTVIDTNDEYVALRVINLHDEPRLLRENTCAAYGEVVSDVVELIGDEDSSRVATICATSDNVPAHVKGLCDSFSDLSPEQQKKATSLILKHQHVFSKSKNDLGRTKLIQHKINTGDARPTKQAPRRLPLSKRDEAEKEVQRMLE